VNTLQNYNYMTALPFQHGLFVFVSPGKFKHELVVRVTPSISLEWELWVDGLYVGRYLDTRTNILLTDDINRALSFSNVTRVYNQLLNESQAQP
jgi:hypothetical protein